MRMSELVLWVVTPWNLYIDSNTSSLKMEAVCFSDTMVSLTPSPYGFTTEKIIFDMFYFVLVVLFYI
jgi:hypothetical protein